MNYLVIAQFGFFLLTIICLLFIDKGIQVGSQALANGKQIQHRYRIGMLSWFAMLAILSLSGFISDFTSFPPKMGIVLMVPLISLILIFRSTNLDAILVNIPPQWLLYIQFFRVPVEIFLWFLFLDGALPERMTFEGYNFDILAGITGPLFAYYCFSGTSLRKTILRVWNISCLLLLFNIVSIALFTLPTPFQYFTAEDNTIVTTFPIVLLPGILVPIAYYMHFFSLRQIRLLTPKA